MGHIEELSSGAGASAIWRTRLPRGWSGANGGDELELSLVGHPLARRHENDAEVLLLGAGYDSCTSFHHEAEYRTAPPVLGAPLEDGERVWNVRRHLHLFRLGRDFEQAC